MNKEGIQTFRASTDVHPILLKGERQEFIEEVVRRNLSNSIAEHFKKLMEEKDSLLAQETIDSNHPISKEPTKRCTVEFNLISNERLRFLLEIERQYNEINAHWLRQMEWRNK